MEIWPLIFDQQDCFHCQRYKSYVNHPPLSFLELFLHHNVVVAMMAYSVLYRSCFAGKERP